MTMAAPDDEADPAGVGEKSLPRQAVVVVHGMGEQKPMSTLRGFVRAVWEEDLSLTGGYRHRSVRDALGTPKRLNKTWNTPDKHAGSHELRRITTPTDIHGRTTDFYELYWADITQGTTRGRLYAWMKTLLWRRWRDVPADARRLYWVTLLLALVLLAVTVAPLFFSGAGVGVSAVIAVIAGGVLWAVDQYLVPYFGDVAAYVRAEAGTVEKRALVRERGLSLLRGLSEDDRYDRIVLVSHSLGSIIAYDLLQILWAEYRPQEMEKIRDRDLFAVVRAVDHFAALENDMGEWTPEIAQHFRRAQWALYQQLRRHQPAKGVKGRWKISDFVTLGSPLTHAEFLITDNVADWREGVRERLFGICPPLTDGSTTRRLHYDTHRLGEESRRPQYALHHGAAFAATRWTNFYDIGNRLTTGDPISGPMQENFGPGVEEIRLELRRDKCRFFTHTGYWAPNFYGYEVLPDGTQGRLNTIALRDAIDLRRVLEPTPLDKDDVSDAA